MAFVKKDWKDRIAEFINRRRLTYEDGRTELVEVARDEGTVSQEGDAFIAETMNDLEERIEKALTPLNTMEEIEANTQDNQLAGALAVKELSEDVKKENKEQDDKLAEVKSRVQQVDVPSEVYANGGNCYLLLCSFKITSYFSAILTIKNSFWGAQHGTADVIFVHGDNTHSSAGTVYLYRTHLGGNIHGASPYRPFYYKVVDGYVYIYVYATGGNQHGRWSVTMEGNPDTELIEEGSCTSDKPSDVTEIPDAGAYSRTGHEHTKINTREYRPSSANISSSNRAAIEYFLATSAMSEGKPPFDGYIIHLNWDGSSGWDTQLAIATIETNCKMVVRGSNGNGEWSDWTKVLTAKDCTVSGTKLTINLD